MSSCFCCVMKDNREKQTRFGHTKWKRIIIIKGYTETEFRDMNQISGFGIVSLEFRTQRFVSSKY